MIAIPPSPPRKKKETQISRGVLVAVNRIPGVRVSRNNNGRSPIPCSACRGKLCRACAMRLAFPITFGLGDGSPDLVGLITIGGHFSAVPALRELEPFAVAFGIEVKQPGKDATPDQRAWHRVALARGMHVCTVTNTADAVVYVVDLIRQTEARLRRTCTRLAGIST